MLPFLSWYVVITLLGWLTFPLVHRLFPALRDRGYTLARAVGLLVWGYAFWLLASLGLAQNDIGGVLLGLLVLAVLSAWSFLHRPPVEDRQSKIENPQASIENRKSEILTWIRSNISLIVVSEFLFLLAFASMALIRSANPEILGTEKPMELMLINSVLRSPSLPPHDAWLSGYAISYYYFGYVMTAMLARLTSVPGTMAFNLMISLVFALGAAGAYGILYNLINPQSPITNYQSPGTPRKPSILLPLFGPLFLLLASNFEGFLELLHRHGVFWRFNPEGSTVSSFWSWLDMQELSQPPALPLGGLPTRHWWWWRASRVVQDYTLQNTHQEIIDEFPFFSFLLGDLHPHVLAIPFGLLAVGVALNLFLGGWRGQIDLLGVRLRINPQGFLCVALVLGGLAFLNTWDILIAAALIVCAYALARARTDGWSWSRLEDVFLFGIPVGVTAILLYLPFYFSFSSQAGGPLPNLVNPTRGAHLWVMFGPLFLPLMAFLAYAWRRARHRWKTGLTVAVGLPLALWAVSWLLAWVAMYVRPELAQLFLISQGVPDVGPLFVGALARRLAAIGGLLTLLALLFPALSIVAASSDSDSRPPEDPDAEAPQAGASVSFVAMLIALGALLVLVPDFIYLRDQFGWRINTVFKFYYQAWMLLSLAAAFAVAVLWQRLRGLADWLFRIGLALVLFAALVYPVLGIANRTSNFRPFFGFSLDDFDRVQRENPDEAAAMQFLLDAPVGVVAEASFEHNSYTHYARISTYTGMPTVLGWLGHESQWRGGYEPQGSRLADLETLYTTSNWDSAREVLERYEVRYVVVGGLERSTYPVQEEKFRTRLRVVFQRGDLTIYEVP